MSSVRRSARQSAGFVTGRRAVGRRVWALAVLLVLPLTAVGGRLVQWQVIEHERWAAQALGNKRRLLPTRSSRGRIVFAHSGETAAGEQPVFGVEVIAGDTCPDAECVEAIADALGVPTDAAARLLRRRDPRARQVVHAERVEAWQRTCRALAAALGGEPAPPRTPPRPAFDPADPFRDRVATAPVRAAGPRGARAAAAPGLDDILGRAAGLEAEAVHRMGREWARIVGIALRVAGVSTPMTTARRAAADGDAAHVAWIAEQGEPVLLPEPGREALAAMAERRRAALQADLTRRGLAAVLTERGVAQQLRDADRIFARYLGRALADRPLLLVPEIDDDAVLALEVRPGGPLPGVEVVARGRRVYPLGDVACHVLGAVGLEVVQRRADGSLEDEYEAREAAGVYWDRVREILEREDYERLESIGAFRGEPYGQTGIERAWDTWLTGRYGVRITENDARGRLRETLLQVPAVAGRAVQLTLDPRAQRTAQEALAAVCTTVRHRALAEGLERAEQPSTRGAAAVVIDVRTGAVLVCASSPTFDPNQLVPPVPAAVAAQLYTSPAAQARPTWNRAIQGCYPPGSVLKVVAAAAAMHDGSAPGERFLCTGSWSPPNDRHVFRCMHPCGEVTYEEALERSCNVTFYQTGYALGSARLVAAARALGLGTSTACGLPYESGGRLPDGANAVQLAIGQGEVLATPMQVARLYAAIANAGRLVVPRLVAGEEPAAAPTVDLLTPEVTARLHDGLRRVVVGGHGTAREVAALRRVGAAGKTGTADKPAERGMQAGPWNMVWFAGFAPFDAPRYAVAVVVEWVPHKMYAGDVAAPVAGAILEAVMAPERGER